MDRSQGRLVAVVVTHNRLAQLQVTLARLLESAPEVLSAVVVVDNASSDGTQAWLAAQGDKRLHVLRSDVNAGGAGGFARGMAHAMAQCAPDWLVLMDDDGRPASGCLETFRALDLSGWDAVAAAVYHPDGRICALNRPLRLPGPGLRGAGHLRPADYEGGVRAVDVATFVGFFVSRQAVERFGYPDPRLFIYGDDGLYSLGLVRAGGRLGFVPALRFEHDPSTFGASQPALRPMWKVYYYHRNLLLFYRLAGGRAFWPLLPLLLVKWSLKVRHYPGRRRRFLALLARAVGDGVTGLRARDHAEVLALDAGRDGGRP